MIDTSAPHGGHGVSSDREGVPGTVVAACVVAVALCSVLLVVTNSSLVGDGSYYLLRAIQTGGAFQLPGRQVINYVREGPLLIGTTLGITNTHVLTVLEGIGFILFPALAWGLSLAQARRSRVQFTLVALSCGLCFASMIIFSVSELTLALPLIILASVLLTRPDPWSRVDAAIVLVAVGLLVVAHESVAPCMVVLTVQSLLRIRARLGVRDTRISSGVAVLALLATAVALWTLTYRPNSNSTDFLTNVEHARPSSIVLLVMGGLCLLGWAGLHGRGKRATWIGWALVVPAGLFTVFGIQSAVRAGPEAAYAARGFCVLVVLGSQLLLLIHWLRCQRSEGSTDSLRLPVGATRGLAVFLVALMIIPTVCAVRWALVVDAFRSTITHNSGVVPAHDVRTPLATSYLWPWTNTTLSVVLRSSESSAVVANSDPINPFPRPAAEQQLPPHYTWGG